MKRLIKNAIIVNEGLQKAGSIVIADDHIAEIHADTTPHGTYDETVDATGCFVFPGIIDSHVHFREPGLTRKADMESESRAAAYGGVTSFFDMPNTQPQTTTPEALEEKFALAAAKSHVNYSFFFGATNENASLFPRLDTHRIPGIKLFMGSSTGNMLVDRRETLEQIFATAPLPIMAHCEDTGIINQNMARVKAEFGSDPAVGFHPVIRSEEACYESTRLAVELATRHHARLHIAHLTTARELELIDARSADITAEATIAHLMFTDRDYARLGTLIKCNPAIKRPSDREALRKALTDGRIATIGTDHAPHLLSEKQGGCAKAASGMPMIQFSLVAMLELADQGVLTLERIAELMCHNPARLFSVNERGFIRQGMKADLTIVKPHAPWTVTEECIQSRCKWSPMTGHTFDWQVTHTFCNGHPVYAEGRFDENSRGEAISFR